MPKGRYAHHARLHAQGRQPRPRHDAAHLHHPGQSRLCVRGRHGAEVPRRPRAAAARHRLVRQFALHRRQAQRLPLLPQPHLVGHRSATAPACCRSCSRTASATSAMSTTRSTCRCTSSFRDGKYIDAAGQSFRDFLDRQAARAARREAAAVRLDRPSLDRLPRGPAEELPRDARRRRRAVEPDLRAARFVGRPALRPGRARRGLGRGQALDDRGAPGGCATRCRSSASRRPRPTARACSSSASACSPSPMPACSARGRLNGAGDNESGFLDPLRETLSRGPDPGRAFARTLSWRMGRRHQPRLRRIQLLMNVPRRRPGPRIRTRRPRRRPWRRYPRNRARPAPAA